MGSTSPITRSSPTGPTRRRSCPLSARSTRGSIRATGIERTTSRTTLGGTQPPVTTIGGALASYVVHDTTMQASPSTHGALYATRPLDVWTTLIDWIASPDARTVATCEFRDYPRLVLSRRGARGEERLFIDQKSGYPVKLDRVEPDYLWGTAHVEYVYSTWQSDGALRWPASSFRVVDGQTDVTRTYGSTRLEPSDRAPSLSIPARTDTMTLAPPAFMVASNPDTVRVGDHTFLLHNVGFNEAVTLVRGYGLRVRRDAGRGAGTRRFGVDRQIISRETSRHAGGHRHRVAACRRPAILDRQWRNRPDASGESGLSPARHRSPLDAGARPTGTPPRQGHAAATRRGRFRQARRRRRSRCSPSTASRAKERSPRFSPPIVSSGRATTYRRSPRRHSISTRRRQRSSACVCRRCVSRPSI